MEILTKEDKVVILTKEEVQKKRYKNSNKAPKIGDIVSDSSGSIFIVHRIGGCASTFQNGFSDNKFVLTHPEELTLVSSLY